MRHFLVVFLTFFHFAFHSSVNAVTLDVQLENTNILTHVDELSDFNRLRLEAFAELEGELPLRGTLIIDNNTSYIGELDRFDNEVDLYRAILEYPGDNFSILLGKQRVPLGVGRIWNPIDIFNPIDITSVEPEEREGTDSLRLEYYPTSLSTIDVTVSEEKAGLRLKTFYKEMDIGIVSLYENEPERYILGWEVEGSLFSTGIDYRSEGGIFYDTKENDAHTELILGLEYAFPESITLLLEYYANQEDRGNSLATLISSQLNPLLSVSYLMIRSLEDNSTLLSPSLNYSLSDEMTLNCGVFIYRGSPGEIYASEDLIFLSWFIQF